MRYNLVLGDYRRLRDFTNATDKLGTCPNEKRHGRSEKPHNPSKGGRCLINCIGGSKIYIHNAVVATLAKRINGKGWAVARPRYIRVAAKQHLKLERCPPYQDLLVCLGEEIRSMGKTSF